MSEILAVASALLAVGWIPIALRFNRGWKSRKNPVSLAISACCLMFAYVNVLFAFALLGQASWEFFSVATHVFDLVVLVNFYVAFRWSDARFPDARSPKGQYSIPPTNSTSTTRHS